MRLDEFDSAAIRDVLDSMAPFVLREGHVYSCLTDMRVRAHTSEKDAGSEHLLVEEGAVVIPCRTSEGEEAVLIGGTVVPFPWSLNASRLLFTPISS